MPGRAGSGGPPLPAGKRLIMPYAARWPRVVFRDSRLALKRKRIVRDNAHVADPTTEFFDGLGQRGYEPLLRKSSGTVRFEIVDGKRTERRYVSVDRGNVSVSRRRGAAQGVIRADRALFGRIATGELNPIAAVLRGELAVEGDWRLLVLVQRLFPGPPRKRASRRAAGYSKRAS